ncbi:MAG TPA: hypothetical protein VGE59_04935 [Patescibacteria group bacterium]
MNQIALALQLRRFAYTFAAREIAPNVVADGIGWNVTINATTGISISVGFNGFYTDYRYRIEAEALGKSLENSEDQILRNLKCEEYGNHVDGSHKDGYKVWLWSHYKVSLDLIPEDIRDSIVDCTRRGSEANRAYHLLDDTRRVSVYELDEEGTSRLIGVVREAGAIHKAARLKELDADKRECIGRVLQFLGLDGLGVVERGQRDKLSPKPLEWVEVSCY